MEKRISIKIESTKETKSIYMHESINGIYVTATGGNDTSFIIPQDIVSKFIRMNDILEFEIEANRKYGAGEKSINLKIMIDINDFSGCMTVGIMTGDSDINAYTIEHDYLLEIFNLAKRAEMMGKL